MSYLYIREDKRDSLASDIGKALKYMGRAMTCIEELESEGGSEMGERNYHDYRDGYRGGYRDDWNEIGERRGMIRYRRY